MVEKRHYHIVVGSKSFFDSAISDVADKDAAGFLELVRLWDNAKQAKEFDKSVFEKMKVSTLIIKNDNYHGIVEAAHDRLGGLIEDLTTARAKIYVHNPPQRLISYLADQHRRQIIDLDIKREEYNIKRDPERFLVNISDIREKHFRTRLRN